MFQDKNGKENRSTNGGGGRKFVPVFGGNGTKTILPGDIFDDLPPGEMSSIWSKLFDHVGRGSFSPIPERGFSRDIPGDEIVESLPPILGTT